VYKPDITVGENPQLRGHWADRLPAIDADIALVAKRLESAKAGDGSGSKLIRVALGRLVRSSLPCSHTPASTFYVPRRATPRPRAVHGFEGKRGSRARVLPARQPGRAISHCGDESEGRTFSSHDPFCLHRFSLPARILLRTETGSFRLAIPGIRCRADKSAVFCGSTRIGRKDR
jgi:hypothetical protein